MDAPRVITHSVSRKVQVPFFFFEAAPVQDDQPLNWNKRMGEKKQVTVGRGRHKRANASAAIE